MLQSHLQILHSMILIIYILTPFTMTYSIHLFHGFHPNPHDGVCRHRRSPTKSEAEVNFGRMHRPHTLVGIITPYPQSFFKTIFPVSKRLYPFHPHCQHAAQVLYWLCHASHARQGVQSFTQVPSTHQRTTGSSRASAMLLARP